MNEQERQKLREDIEFIYANRSEADSTDGDGPLTWYANKVGLTRTSVYRYVNGHRTPDGPFVVLTKMLREKAEKRIRKRERDRKSARRRRATKGA